MPYFLVAAISSSTVFIVLSFAMVITSVVFDPQADLSTSEQALEATNGQFSLIKLRYPKLIPLGLHGICTLVSFLNLVRGGCVATSIFNVGIMGGTLALTWKILISPQLRNSYEHLT